MPFPNGEEAARVERLQFEVFGVPGGTAFKSTEAWRAVNEYVNAAFGILQKRRHEPLKMP